MKPINLSSNYTVLPSISEEPSSLQSVQAEVQNPDYKTSTFGYRPTPSPRKFPQVSIVDIDIQVDKSSEVQNLSYISGGELYLTK